MSQWKGYTPENKPSGASVAEPGPHSAANAGTLTYEPHYGLKAKPFSLSTDPRVLYTAPGHAEALDELLSAIRRREGLIVLTGEMGSGKTTLCRAALYQLDRKTFTTFVPDPFLSREDLLRMLLVDFGEVSVNDLRQGRLTGASRPDLSYQLYEFLTSLESVDAFAVLVIDNAQHLGSPLLDEIRALSELEAGRRLLQIVLVGQPDLETHLKQYHMRHIDQRVTTRCELKPFSREDVTGYVGHRLALAGGMKERVSFSPAALDLVYKASAGVPRVVNLICDRSLSRGHLEQVAVISPAIVAKAMQDLRMMSAPVLEDVRTTERSAPPAPARAVTNPFDELTAPPPVTPPPAPRAKAKPAPGVATGGPYDLQSLLDLSPTVRQEQEQPRQEETTAFGSVPSWKSRVAAERTRSRARFRFLRMLLLPLIGMTVMVMAAGGAFYLQRMRVKSEPVDARPPAKAPAAPAPVASAPAAPALVAAPVAAPVTKALPSPVPMVAAASTVAPPSTTDAWVVQVAAFSRSERAASLVERLNQSGLPAYQMGGNAGEQGLLYFVRIGPYRAAEQANEARAKLIQSPEFEGAFVRNLAAPAANQ